MRPDLIPAVGMALATVGAALQWLRAVKGQKWDGHILSGGVMSACILWAIAVDWRGISDWQAFVLNQIPVLGTLISSLFGGTFVASKTASAMYRAGANDKHLLVPVTGSKGGTP